MHLPIPDIFDLIALLPLLGAGLVVWLILLVVFLIRALAFPPRRGYGWAMAKGRPGAPDEADFGSPPPNVEEWSIRDGRGRDYPVWTISAPDRPDGPTIVHVHGWGESRVTALRAAELLFPIAGRIVLWDLPGHGESPGRSTLGFTEHEVLLALLDALSGPNYDGKPLILHGFSMGGAVALAAAVASTRPIDGLVLEGISPSLTAPTKLVLRYNAVPFRVAGAVAYALLWLISGCPRRRDPLSLAPEVHAPTLYIHGADDAMCPLDEARRLVEATPKARLLVVPGAGHRDAGQVDPESVRAAIAALLTPEDEEPHATPPAVRFGYGDAPDGDAPHGSTASTELRDR
jgi:pimeloyl-ACP methyl ester carboxylesterase